MNLLLTQRPLVLLLLLLGNVCLAQFSASFISPTSLCLNETISITNTSQNANSFIWDFCDKDLEATPIGNAIGQMPNDGLVFYAGIQIVFEKGNWYGIVSSSDRNRFYRLDFGPVLSSNPIVVDLGNLGASFPGALNIVEDNGIFFGIVSTGYAGSITRITWGNGITESPTDVTNFGSLGIISGAEGIKAIVSNNERYVFVTNSNTGNISIIKFGSSFSNSIQETKQIGGNEGLVGPWGIDFINEGDNWFGLLSCRNSNKVYRLSFGTSLFSDPIFTELGTLYDGTSLKLVREGTNFIAIIRSRILGLYRINFGQSIINTPVIENLGYLGVLQGESRSLELIRDSPYWYAFSVDIYSAKLNRIDFYGNCQLNMALNSTTQNNFEQVYKTPGSYVVELTAIDNTGNRSVASTSILVENIEATDITITSDANRCLGVPNNFNVVSSLPITEFNWDFNGEATSITDTPSHQFDHAGSNYIFLNVTDLNGCHNKSTTAIEIFNQPIADFSLPLINGTVCTEQLYQFSNSSTYDVGSNPTWQWQIDGSDVSSLETLNYNFHDVDNFNVTLLASIPGCSSIISKNFQVTGVGDLVDFSVKSLCLGQATQFINNNYKPGAIYDWEFGDGQSSAQPSPSHQFTAIGNYSVKLTINNNIGCKTFGSQIVQLSSIPQPSFFIDTPPFSCAGTPTLFHDATPSMTDSNITNWKWNFNDGSGASSTLKDPSHIYSNAGSYNVDLEVETNYGCKNNVSLPITISSSPVANFNTSSLCLNKPVSFTNTSSSGIQLSRWLINGNSFTTSNASYTFTNTGNYTGSLTVKGSNNCENTITKPIVIKPIPTLNFSTTPICATQETFFTDQSLGADLPSSWTWNFGSGNTLTGSPATFSFPSVGVFPVSMSVITQAGCNYSFTKDIFVAYPPKALFEATPLYGDKPLKVQFKSQSQNATSLKWNFGDALSSTSLIANPSFTFNELGEYNVQLTASNSVGCSDTFSKIIRVLIANIDLSLDKIEIKELNNNAIVPVLTIKNNSNVDVVNINLNLSGSLGTQLSTNLDINLPPGTAKSFEVPIQFRSSEKYLCVELADSRDILSNNNSQCINLTNQSIVVQPYPNPSNGIVVFEAMLLNNGSGSLKILDSKGHMVFKNSFPSMSVGINQFKFDMTGNSPGLYVAIWEINGVKSEYRFILQ